MFKDQLTKKCKQAINQVDCK